MASRNCEHVVAVNKDMSDNARPTYSTLVPNTPARDPKLPTPNAPTRSRTSANEVLYESLRAVCRRRGGGGKHRLPHPPSPEVSRCFDDMTIMIMTFKCRYVFRTHGKAVFYSQMLMQTKRAGYTARNHKLTGNSGTKVFLV